VQWIKKTETAFDQNGGVLGVTVSYYAEGFATTSGQAIDHHVRTLKIRAQGNKAKKYVIKMEGKVGPGSFTGQKVPEGLPWKEFYDGSNNPMGAINWTGPTKTWDDTFTVDITNNQASFTCNLGGP
jgi:hypothetical protein